MSTTATQTDGSDLLKAPFSNCQFYAGDTITKYAKYYPYNIIQRIDMSNNVATAKAALRPTIINNAIGFVNRFQSYIDNYLVAKLLAPISVQTADSTSKDSLAFKLSDITTRNGKLRESLDVNDDNMVSAVGAAWGQDKDIINQAAQRAAGVLSQAESQGPQFVNAEMKQMVNLANQAVRQNTQTISQLAKAQILQTNSTARQVLQQANMLLQATNSTLNRAKTVFVALNTTDKNLGTSQSNLNARLAALKTSIITKAQQTVLTAQNRSSDAQLRASAQVDTALQGVVQAVATALQRLTSEESANLTSITSSVDSNMNSLVAQIQSNLNDATRGAASLQSTYQQNVTSGVSDASQLFSQVDQSLGSISSSASTANATMQALKGFMTTQFNDLNNQITAAYNNQSQQAQMQQVALSTMMDSTLASFKVKALNLTQQGSASLKSAYDAAIQAVTSGSDSLSLSFEQRQKIIAALSNWQQNYQGNTNQLVSSFGNTYSGLITDTNSALSSSVAQQSAQIAAMTADQQKLMADAIAAAQGDPTKLKAILAQFGIVGDRATAAAQAIAQNMQTAGSTIQNGLSNGMTALNLIQQAASATSDTYQQASSLNSQAASLSQSAVQNVTARLGTMNAVMQTYATQLANQLFGATSSANQQIQGSATNNSQQLSADLQAKMASVQQMLSAALSKGQMSATDLNAFAAQVGANATALTNLVNALQTGSSDAISSVTNAQKGSIDQLKSQVADQLNAVSSSFNSQLDSQKNSVSSLVEGLRSDLTSQAGAKSALLVQQRDLLQSLFGTMSSSSIQRDAASSSMKKQLSEAEAKSATSLTELSGLIGAQKSRVMTAFNEQNLALKNAYSAVNGTISDTQNSANSALADLRSKGETRVKSIQKSLSDNAIAINMMTQRYQDNVAAALEKDRVERLRIQADELSRLSSVQAAFAQSKADQDAAAAARLSQAKARADALAAMLMSLNGTAAAAAQGDAAFVQYVTALAAKTNTNMGLLVQALQGNIASGNSDLKKMLNQNGIFAQGVLNDLNKQAAALGQGAVDGGNGLLNSLFASRSQSQAAAAQQAAVFNGIGSSTSQMQSLTNDQLVQLLTVFLAQSAVQDSEFAKANQATMGAVGSLSDAMDISLSTMDAISNMTQDALNLSSNETSEAEVEVNEATQAVVDFASQAASNITETAEGYYSTLKTAIDQASSFTSAFKQRLNDDRNTFTSAQPGFDQSVAKLKSDITNLGVTVNANRQAAIDRVNDWAMSMEQNALNQLSSMQVPAASTP